MADASEHLVRATMGGKPVYSIPVKSVINFDSGFAPKLLCDGPTFSTGTSCVYSCSFCYVPPMMLKSPHLAAARAIGAKESHPEMVLRRADALEILRGQLVTAKGTSKIKGSAEEGRVIYASPLVDVAASVELAKETAAACRIILDLTPWHIRLLSKSNLLPLIAKELGSLGRGRVIYGVSSGTFDDAQAAAFEEGTALASKRIASLHRLQDEGQRTFGMICPSLPQRSYASFAERAAHAIRADRCEHIWAEVINVRGESMTLTCAALADAGFRWEAEELKRVSCDPEAWESYARQTFLAHYAVLPPEKLRFLQYVNSRNRDWWQGFQGAGAVLLGKGAH